MIFFGRKKRYLRAMNAADEAARATEAFKEALRREQDRHNEAVSDLLAGLVPKRGGDDVAADE